MRELQDQLEAEQYFSVSSGQKQEEQNVFLFFVCEPTNLFSPFRHFTKLRSRNLKRRLRRRTDRCKTLRKRCRSFAVKGKVASSVHRQIQHCRFIRQMIHILICS